MKKTYMYGIFVVVVIAIIFIFFSMTQKSYQPGIKQDNIKGSGNVTIIEFSDFECPYCGAVEQTVKQVFQEYGGKVKLQYRHFPISSHQYAEKAAEASECAADQDKFWEYHDKLFENQKNLYMSALKQYASEIGLNQSKFSACLDSGVMKNRVDQDQNAGFSAGVKGTPTFFIAGQKLVGNQQISAFREIIDRALNMG